MSMTSIIIPNNNGLHLLRPCVQSICNHVETPYEIIVVDNGSQDGSVSFCLQKKLKLISLPANRGFAVACNLGLRIAQGDALLLLNNDTLLTPRGLPNMLRCLYSSEAIGIVGPMTIDAFDKQQQFAEPVTTVEDMAEYRNGSDRGIWREVERIAGVCLLFRRELMDRIGMLDERFSPDHFEDDDYCYHSRQTGYRLMITEDAFIYRHGSAGLHTENESHKKKDTC
jgi:GT2 family glycosyltransferase